jgi:hypothetical protein
MGALGGPFEATLVEVGPRSDLEAKQGLAPA